MDTFAPQHATNARRLSRDDLDAVVGIDARLEGHTRRTYFERRLAAAVREANAATAAGEERVIVVALSGHGHFDLAAYDAFLNGRMVDEKPDDARFAASLAELPQVPA